MPTLPRLLIAPALLASVALLTGCPEGGSSSTGGGAPANTPAANAAGPTTAAPPAEPAVHNPDADKRIGDPGLTPYADAAAQHYPQRDAWLKAGVTGGIESGEASATVAVGEDIQAAIDAAGDGAVIELAAGEHTLAKPVTLKSGVVLRGAGDGATLRYDGPTAITATGVTGAGLENLRVVHSAEPPQQSDQFYASADGFKPPDAAAVMFTDASECWISDVTITNAPSHPLALRRSKHLTLRGVTMHGVQNRGPGAGSLVIDRCDGLVLAGISIRGLRHIHLTGPATGNVFRGMVTSAGVFLDDADYIADNLFEDCHFLFRPGNLFEPFAKNRMPLGTGNVVFNCTAYHYGTDAMGRNVLLPGKVFVLRPNEVKPNADKYARKNERGFLTPYTYVQTLPPREDTVPRIAAAWDAPPQGVKLATLASNAPMDSWAITGSIGQAAYDVPIAELVKSPLVPGTSRELAGQSVDVFWVEPKAKPVMGTFTQAPNANRNMGQFGWNAMPPGGGKMELLDRVGGDWEGGLVMQRIVNIPGTPRLAMKQRLVGNKAKVYLGTTEVKEGEPFVLEPGVHAITALVKVDRPTSMIQNVGFEVSFELLPEPEAPFRVLTVPVPDNGTVYPFNPGVDELADERGGLGAWRGFFTGTLRSKPDPKFPDKVDVFIAEHPGTHVAYVAEGIRTIIANAPYQESEDLTVWQWGELFDYYARSGMPERMWAGNKAKKGAKDYRQFYPEQVKE